MHNQTISRGLGGQVGQDGPIYTSALISGGRETVISRTSLITTGSFGFICI